MARFMLLLHESPTLFAQVSPSEIQRIIEEYSAWRVGLEAQGRLVGSEKLKDEGGRHLRRAGDQLQVVDGPFSEAKEVIGGYFLIQADDYNDAVAVSSSCPHLTYGGRIELRAIDPIHD